MENRALQQAKQLLHQQPCRARTGVERERERARHDTQTKQIQTQIQTHTHRHRYRHRHSHTQRHTLRASTRSATSSRVMEEISDTRFSTFGLYSLAGEAASSVATWRLTLKAARATCCGLQEQQKRICECVRACECEWSQFAGFFFLLFGCERVPNKR